MPAGRRNNGRTSRGIVYFSRPWVYCRFAAGYNEGNLVDLVMIVGDKTITNYLYALTEVPVDWPAVPVL